MPKYKPGMTVQYLTNGDPASLRTNEGVIQRVLIADQVEYFINSRWRLENQIVRVIK